MTSASGEARGQPERGDEPRLEEAVDRGDLPAPQRQHERLLHGREDWLARRFGTDMLAASEVGAAVVGLTEERSGAVWWVGPAGLEEWEDVLRAPVKV